MENFKAYQMCTEFIFLNDLRQGKNVRSSVHIKKKKWRKKGGRRKRSKKKKASGAGSLFHLYNLRQGKIARPSVHTGGRNPYQAACVGPYGPSSGQADLSAGQLHRPSHPRKKTKGWLSIQIVLAACNKNGT